MEVEIGIGKSGRRAYGFDDIAIVPSRRTRDPEDIDITWEVDAYKFELPMMAAAERYCELIAHLDPQSARLCKTQVMRIAGVPSANSTRLRRDEAKVGLVPTTFWFG